MGSKFLKLWREADGNSRFNIVWHLCITEFELVLRVLRYARFERKDKQEGK